MNLNDSRMFYQSSLIYQCSSVHLPFHLQSRTYWKHTLVYQQRGFVFALIVFLHLSHFYSLTVSHPYIIDFHSSNPVLLYLSPFHLLSKLFFLTSPLSNSLPFMRAWLTELNRDACVSMNGRWLTDCSWWSLHMTYTRPILLHHRRGKGSWGPMPPWGTTDNYFWLGKGFYFSSYNNSELLMLLLMDHFKLLFF